MTKKTLIEDKHLERDTTEARERLGQLIANARKEKGLTQAEVGDATGIFQTNIARIENGRYNVSVDVLTRIVEVLDCEIRISPVK